jgi:NAD(P)-dependent dehydrogenase (short-subunit alcohol dehydrogenase family)
MGNNWGGSAIATSVRLPGIDESTVVLITGGTGAIGYRAAEDFLGLGAKVAVMSQSQATVDDAVKRPAGLGEVLGRFGRLDVLAHCAAVGGGAPLAEMTADRIDKMLGINMKGIFLMAKAAAAPMREQGRGRIVTVSSIMAHRAGGTSSLYGASKAAVAHTTRALAVELGPAGTTVNCVSPAGTPTALRDVDDPPGGPQDPPQVAAGSGAKVPVGRRGELDDFVGPILFFSSDLATYLTGVDVLADGGISLLRVW